MVMASFKHDYTSEHRRSNTYEASSCQETNCPCERIFGICFRRMHAGTVGSRSGVLTSLLSSGANPRGLHQTLMEVPSPLWWRLQSRVAGSLCDLAMILCPRTVLLHTPGCVSLDRQ